MLDHTLTLIRKAMEHWEQMELIGERMGIDRLLLFVEQLTTAKDRRFQNDIYRYAVAYVAIKEKGGTNHSSAQTTKQSRMIKP